MGSWEDELDLDLSDIFGAATASKPVSGGTQQKRAAEEEEKDDNDDLNFASQAPAQHAIRVSGSESESRITGTEPESRVSETEPEVRVSGLGLEALKKFTPVPQSENVVTSALNADVADAPTQVASLPFVSRGSGSTVPLSTQPLLQSDPKQQRLLPPLPPLATLQPVVSREEPLPTLSFAFDPKQRSRNPNSGEKEKAPVDIRKYFTHRGGLSGAGGDGSSRKKPRRIPGPVGDLFWKEPADDEAAVVDGDGNAALGYEKDDSNNDRMFRKGAWISALHSLNVEEFDPARYAILKVTASNIGSSRTHRVPHFVAVIKELTPNVFGDAAVVLKDPTGTVAGMINNKVFSNTDYAKTISPGAAIVLKQIAIFSPAAHYLNITISNVVQVFPANTDLPQGSAPKQCQDSTLQEGKAPSQPRFQPWSPQPQPQPQPQPEEVQPPQPPTQPLPSPPPQPRSQAPPPEGPKAPEGSQMANWDLLSPSPSPPREEPKALEEEIAVAAKMAGWGDLTDDMEALLNEDVDDFYA